MTETNKQQVKRGSLEGGSPRSCRTASGGDVDHLRIAKKHGQDSIPSHFCCPLTLDVMVDPVLDREGNSFERSAIVEWLQKERISPVSRQPLNEASLIPNLALRHAIHQYMGCEWSTKQEAEANKLAVDKSWRFPDEKSDHSIHMSKKLRRIDGFLQDISRSIGKTIRLNSSGISAFTYEDFTIVVEVPERTDSFYIYTTKTVPYVSPELKDKILELNHLQQQTRGGCLSVTRTEDNESDITFSFSDRAFEINSADFRNILENFIDTAVILRAEILNPGQNENDRMDEDSGSSMLGKHA